MRNKTQNYYQNCRSCG